MAASLHSVLAFLGSDSLVPLVDNSTKQPLNFSYTQAHTPQQVFVHMHTTFVPFYSTLTLPIRCLRDLSASFTGKVPEDHVRSHLVVGGLVAVVACWAPDLV